MELFYDYTTEHLHLICRSLGVASVHAKTLFKSAYKDLRVEPWRHPKLPNRLIKHFTPLFSTSHLTINRAIQSRYDGSVKLVVGLKDGWEIESVIMPETSRVTLCVSSQVGCQRACAFCHTGRMGLKRSLSAGEIIGQIVLANRWISENPAWAKKHSATLLYARVTNVVFMGMGEPMDNLEAVMTAIQIMTDAQGLGIGARKISVSTVGQLSGLRRFVEHFPNIPIAISLHASTNRERSQIMPVNRIWSIHQVIDAIAYINKTTGNYVLVQYTLISGKNDDTEHAHQLAKLLSGLKVKVNLIPLNPISGLRFDSPSAKALQAFRDVLHQSGLRVMIRYSKGQDILAACGQLVS